MKINLFLNKNVSGNFESRNKKKTEKAILTSIDD